MLGDRTRGDDGVIAVLTALLVAFVLLPVAALGLTSYVRAGVAGEMQRAADAGALAAATSLLFVDVDGLDLRSDGAKLVKGPACPAAEVSLGGSWTPQRGAAPLSAAFADTPVVCQADFSLDEAYPQCITHLVANAQTVVDATTASAMRVADALGLSTTTQTLAAPLLGTVQTVLQPMSDSATTLSAQVAAVASQRVSLAQRVFALIPAAQADGIVVQLAYQVGGPLDGVLGRDGRSSRTATSTSRRLFKPLLPTTAAATDALSSPVAADPRLPQVLHTTRDAQARPLLSATERDVVQHLQLLLITAVKGIELAGGKLEGVENDLAATSSDELLRANIRSLHDTIAAKVPLVPADVLAQMLVEPPPLARVNPLNPTCQAAAHELVMALGRALQLNDDEEDLTSCLTGGLLGLPGTTTLKTRDCVKGLFRAQLRPDGTRILPLASS